MSHTPENSAIRLTPEQEREVTNMRADELPEFFRRVAEQNGLIIRDIYSGDPIPVENPAPRPSRFARTVVLPDNSKTIIEGSSESELDTAELKMRREFEHGSRPAASQPRDTEGRFRAQDDADAEAARIANADIKFRTGQISLDEYIRENPAVLDDYLRSRGINPDAVTENQFQSMWQTATQRFVAAHDDWPGGKNGDVLRDIVLSNPELAKASNADEALESLEAAYRHAVESKLLVKNPVADALREMQTTTDPERLRYLAHQAIGLPPQQELGRDTHMLFGK